jgi:hypothetical protein
MQLLNRLQKIIPATLVLPTIGARVFSLLIWIYVYIYIYIYIYPCIYPYVCVCIYIYICVCVCVLTNNGENLQPSHTQVSCFSASLLLHTFISYRTLLQPTIFYTDLLLLYFVPQSFSVCGIKGFFLNL